MSKTQVQMDELSQLVRARMGVRGKTLRHQLQRAARHFPRPLRKDLQPFIKADGFHGHPHLTRLLDQSELDAGFERLQKHLSGVDPSSRHIHRIQEALGTILINGVIIVTLLYAVLRWRGFV